MAATGCRRSIASVLRLSLLRSWTMDHPYWTRSPRPSNCSSAPEQAHVGTRNEWLGTAKAGGLASRTVSDASFSKNISHAIAPARQVWLNDKGLAPMASAVHRIDADGE